MWECDCSKSSVAAAGGEREGRESGESGKAGRAHDCNISA